MVLTLQILANHSNSPIHTHIRVSNNNSLPATIAERLFILPDFHLIEQLIMHILNHNIIKS